MKLFILLGLISLSWATVTIDLKNTCPCAGYLTQTICQQQLYCFWENNFCRTKTCTDQIKTESECQINNFIDSVCVWENESCVAFTKCSDYVPGTSGCSSKFGLLSGCQDNATGTACEDIPKYICENFTTKHLCIQYKCIWINSDTNNFCKNLSMCSQLTTEESCSEQSSSCFYDKTCKDKTCSTITDPIYCNQTFNIDITVATLCQWNLESKECIEAPDTSYLTSEDCRYSTFNSHFWDGTKCTKCPSSGSDSNSNTNSTGSASGSSTNSSGSDPNSNSTTSGSDSNSSNSNSSNSNSSTGLTSDLTKICPCANFLEEMDCKKMEIMCIWKNNSCKQRKCEEYPSQTDCPESLFTEVCEWDTTCKPAVGGNCKKYTYKIECNEKSKHQNCVWKNDKCEAFTKCSDYVPGTSGCSSKSGRFQACKNNAAGTACEDASKDSVTCDSFLTSETCTTTYSEMCIWNQKCQDFKNCKQYPDQICSWLTYFCTFDSSCRDSVCSDYQTQEKCKY